MKTIVLIFIGLVVLTSCDIKFETKRVTDEEVDKTEKIEEMVGNDSDEHGCKTSAGYQWSEIKSDCIRLFESGKRYNPISMDKEKSVSSAFVVMGNDLKKVELFIPNQKQSILLKQTEVGKFSNGKYTVTDSIILNDLKPTFRLNK